MEELCGKNEMIIWKKVRFFISNYISVKLRLKCRKSARRKPI